MRKLSFSILLVLTACGSSQDGGASGDDTSPTGGDPQGAGGMVDMSAAGGSALVGGSSGAPGGTSTGGSVGTAGALGAGGANVSTGAGGKSGTGGAGGTSNVVGAGGSTGAGGSAAMTGSPCTNLPAVGTWQSILPYAVGGPAFGEGFGEAISVDPFDTAIVWLGTGSKGIYKSTNCGATFTHMNTGRNAATFERGNHISMLVDPVDRGVIYVANIHDATNLWKSTDGGVDWDQLFPPGSEVDKITHGVADAVSMDPNDHKHLIIGFHGNCEAPYAPACEAETTDSGATWRLFKLPSKGWEEGAGPWVIDATTSLYGGTSGLFITTDRGATWKDVSPSGAWAFEGGEVETHPIHRGPDGTYYITSLQGMVKSTDTKTWTLMPNSGGRLVGFTSGDGLFITSDQWSATYHTAKMSDPTVWTKLAPPAALPADQGAPFIDYDSVHNILYSSNFAGGLWRVVLP